MDRPNLKNPIFLSASLPKIPSEGPDKDPKYWKTRNLLNLREAIRELASVVLPKGQLVFGGHPAVNPLILSIADRLSHNNRPVKEGTVASYRDRIVVYQSRHYMKVFPPEIESFPHVALTLASDSQQNLFQEEEKEPPSDQEYSLLHMRYRMLGKHKKTGWEQKMFPQVNNLAKERLQRFKTDQFQAGFFLGGMDGVEKEYEIFRAFHPETPVFILPTTGSAAKFLFDREQDIYGAKMASNLETLTIFGALFDHLLWPQIDWTPPPPPPLDRIPGFWEKSC